MTEYSFHVCPMCGINYAVDKRVMDWKRDAPADNTKRGWYCPNGDSLVFTESQADKYRREAERLRQKIAEKDDAISARDRQLTAAKGQITKERNRSAAGVCPCCNRTFSNMARHMHTKHPDFTKAPVKLEAVA